MSDPLNCPRCGRPLTPDASEARSLLCTQCGGTLLSAPDIRQELLESAIELSTPIAEQAGGPERKPAINCPACAQPMREMQFGSVVIDRCTACAAMWLDAGELLPSEVPTDPAKLTSFLMYTLSLPERVVRSTVGVAAGTATELSKLLVPQAFHSSKTYEVVVRNSLKFLVEDVGGVAAESGAQPTAEGFMARKAVGNFVDMAGLATLHVSPLWVLAVVSDVAYGTRTYLAEFAEELKKQGLIDETSTIYHADDVLEAISKASGTSATLFDSPPLSVDELRQTLQQARDAANSADLTTMLPESELRRYWDEMREISQQNDVSLLGVSAALTMHSLGKIKTASSGTLAGLQVAGGMFQRHIIGHYQRSLTDMHEQGYYAFVRNSAAPYIEAVWKNFAFDRETWTEAVVSGRAFSKAGAAVAKWFRRKDRTNPIESPGDIT